MYKLIVLSLLLLARPAFAGPEFGPGNGGDIVECQASAQNGFVGPYTLDYLMTYNSFNNNQDIVTVKNWTESIERMRRFLTAFSPEKKASFENFLGTLDNHTDYSLKRIWVTNQAAPLVNIRDENLQRLIPVNCTRGASGIDAIQAVIRIQSNNMIRYETDVNVLNKIQTRPLQYSFLMIHEWLRDFTQDADKIRQINRFFHSNIWEKEGGIASALMALYNLGIISTDDFSTLGTAELAKMMTAINEKNLGDLTQSVQKGAQRIRISRFMIWTGYWNYNPNYAVDIFYFCEPLNSGGVYELCKKPSLIAWQKSFLNSGMTATAYSILNNFNEGTELLIKADTAAERSSDIRAVLAALAMGNTQLASRLVALGYTNPFLSAEPTQKSYDYLFSMMSILKMSRETIKNICNFEGVKCPSKKMFAYGIRDANLSLIQDNIAEAAILYKPLEEGYFTKMNYKDAYHGTVIRRVYSCGNGCYAYISALDHTIASSLIEFGAVENLEAIKAAGLLQKDFKLKVQIEEKGKTYKKTITLREYARYQSESDGTFPKEKEKIRALRKVFQ